MTNRSGVEVANTNAVTIGTANVPDAIEKVRSLTRCCAALVTENSVLDGLPIDGEPLTTADIAVMVTATKQRQQAILAAIEDYKRHSRSKSVSEPSFPPTPSEAGFRPTEDTATQRAFTTANYLGKVSRTGLKTDEERRRRTARPRTGETPWIVPDDLNDAEVAAFPAELAARLHEQPLV